VLPRLGEAQEIYLRASFAERFSLVRRMLLDGLSRVTKDIKPIALFLVQENRLYSTIVVMDGYECLSHECYNS
jgi:hypothetical protein